MELCVLFIVRFLALSKDCQRYFPNAGSVYDKIT